MANGNASLVEWDMTQSWHLGHVRMEHLGAEAVFGFVTGLHSATANVDAPRAAHELEPLFPHPGKEVPVAARADCDGITLIILDAEMDGCPRAFLKSIGHRYGFVHGDDPEGVCLELGELIQDSPNSRLPATSQPHPRAAQKVLG